MVVNQQKVEDEVKLNHSDIESIIKEKKYKHEEILEKLDLKNLKELVLKAPQRKKSKLKHLVEYLQKNTSGLNEFERGYIIFYWLH